MSRLHAHVSAKRENESPHLNIFLQQQSPTSWFHSACCPTAVTHALHGMHAYLAAPAESATLRLFVCCLAQCASHDGSMRHSKLLPQTQTSCSSSVSHAIFETLEAHNMRRNAPFCLKIVPAPPESPGHHEKVVCFSKAALLPVLAVKTWN